MGTELESFVLTGLNYYLTSRQFPGLKHIVCDNRINRMNLFCII